MALQLAPYNSSMKLGSGFNSYTQQICVDGAVTRDETKKQASIDFGAPDSEIAQSVTFKTEVIEKTSDLTDALDVNGALNIKASSISGVRGTGSFVNSNIVNESDLNFLITCKVVNQTVHDTTLTKFVPLSNMGNANFTDIFGDCFISGFQVGGEFNALISIKVRDTSRIEEIKANANIAFTTPHFASQEAKKADGQKAVEGETKPEDQAVGIMSEKTAADKKAPAAGKDSKGGGFSIEADAKVEKDRMDILSENTVTISVSWTGGGQQLKPADKDWDYETLRAAAIKFPDLVAKTPVRTHAVLTKYTALRSYYEVTRTIPHAIISYENAGAYTTMLQDAYLDYKNLLKDVQLLAMDFAEGRKDLEWRSKPTIPALPAPGPKPPSTDASTDTGPDILTPGTSTGAADDIPSMEEAKEEPSPGAGLVEKPEINMPPSMVTENFELSIYGLEKAKREIRRMMTRIVKEVDKVAREPSLTQDESRELPFQSPLLFKQFVPVGKLKAAPAASE